MRFLVKPEGRDSEIRGLFEATFTASEGPEEGRLIAGLVASQLATTPEPDIYVIAAENDDRIVGAGVFTRLLYPEDDRTVFVLGPVAVATERQRQGLGQELIRHGLQVLREAGADVVMTYGDPAYYTKVGFAPVSEADAAAPFELKYPHGWLARSLTAKPWSAIKGASTCVAALNDPVFW